MKAKFRLEIEIDIPDYLNVAQDSDIVSYTDKTLRDMLYVGAEYDSAPEHVINIDSLRVLQFFRQDLAIK